MLVPLEVMLVRELIVGLFCVGAIVLSLRTIYWMSLEQRRRKSAALVRGLLILTAVSTSRLLLDLLLVLTAVDVIRAVALRLNSSAYHWTSAILAAAFCVAVLEILLGVLRLYRDRRLERGRRRRSSLVEAERHG